MIYFIDSYIDSFAAVTCMYGRQACNEKRLDDSTAVIGTGGRDADEFFKNGVSYDDHSSLSSTTAVSLGIIHIYSTSFHPSREGMNSIN